MEIKAMRDEDLHPVKAILKEAFWKEGKNEIFNEWEFAEKVMSDSGYIDDLCLIAIDKNAVVGYILLSKSNIGGREGLSLGPLAVKPINQNKGIGKALVKYALKKAREKGFDWVALTGGDYYRQFGFLDALDFDIILSENNPENKFLKILFLNDKIKNSVNGKMHFCSSFYDEYGELL
jgi:putative acetyltransferase